MRIGTFILSPWPEGSLAGAFVCRLVKLPVGFGQSLVSVCGHWHATGMSGFP